MKYYMCFMIIFIVIYKLKDLLIYLLYHQSIIIVIIIYRIYLTNTFDPESDMGSSYLNLIYILIKV